jgi:alginate O-acetyltransferase complex protein AlgI
MTLQDIKDFLPGIFLYHEEAPLLFTQFYFWAFFAVVFAFLSLTHNKKLLRNTFLLFASLFFYYKTSGLFVLILVFSTLVDFFIGKGLHKSESTFKRKSLVSLSVLVNLGVLAYFKYAYFFTDAYNNLFDDKLQVVNWLAKWTNSVAGTGFDVGMIMLPVGISFYTFQTISYSIDIYRKRIPPVRNILDFGFYVSFFPQLVAGPIVRANQFVPQLYNKYSLSRMQFGIAIFWILNGLVKKMILGDYIAVNFVDRVFTNPLMHSGFENFMALIGYSMQVYADFSGYTDIAIGVAMLMGFHLPVNFNSPYKATNPGEFWKRWHISLSTWLKDYLYIPLGGNRKGTFGTFLWISVIALFAIILSENTIALYIIGLVALLLIVLSLVFQGFYKNVIANINLMVTMLIGGLWHGASWNFMIWGGLNGAGIVIFKFWNKMSRVIKALVTFLLFGLMIWLQMTYDKPLLMMGVVWSGVIFSGALIRWVSSLIFPNNQFNGAERAWSIFITFIFISFTRLFFRSGSNLEPAETNRVSLETASNMVAQIGGKWHMDLIPDMIWGYRAVFSLILIGLIIHWLPSKFKQWYRIRFARLPKWMLLTAVVMTVFVIYQFITADLQPFIYFQF